MTVRRSNNVANNVANNNNNEKSIPARAAKASPLSIDVRFGWIDFCVQDEVGGIGNARGSFVART